MLNCYLAGTGLHGAFTWKVGVQVKIIDEENTEVVLRTDGSGKGMEGDEGMDVLPPLAPGQKPRAQGTDQS